MSNEPISPPDLSDQRIQFFFDLTCPYAYQTSLWIRDVREQTGLSIDWRFFSLEEINRRPDQKHPWEREWSYGWSMLRIGAWLRRQDMGLVDDWYAAAGRALHIDGRQPFLREGAADVADELGLPADTVRNAIADATTTDDVKRDHEWIVREHAAYGVPTIVFPNGHALFGPVVVPAPTGEAALRLWDLVSGWSEFSHPYELRKPKTPDDFRHIGVHFMPYLQARQWQTIQTPVD